jgi:hypothetical protein
MAKEREVASAARLAAEGGIASDESTVAELEIEANDGPAEEHEKEPDENTAWEGEYGEAGCPIWMGYSEPLRCRRELHVAPDGVDETPVCLMHSKDPRKQSGPLFDTFWLEFERVLKDAGEGEAHFERFVFPQFHFYRRKYQAICRFWRATFTQDAYFREATFAQDADFFQTTFKQGADFRVAIFKKNAHFREATFTQDANFWRATFKQGTIFSYTAFTQDADFSWATFTQDAAFGYATFTQDADFNYATFSQNAYFDSATFTQAAGFIDTKFHGTASWRESRFLDQAEFRNTKFDPQIAGRPSARFALARFSKPGEIVFDDVDLSHVLFHNCDVSQVWFTSSVVWRTRDDNRGFAVFEETFDDTVHPGEVAWVILHRDGQRDYRAVAQIYQQLKKNYDSRLDYWTANEFHFGEMEMKRLAGPTSGRLLWLRRWWHPRLSFVAWYKYASDYGNSYGWPLFWLFVTLLAATLLFPVPGVGLRQPISGNAANSASVTYSREWNRQDSWTNNIWTEAKLIGKSGITAIDMSTFQRTPEYTPVYPWGRVLAIVETLLTSSLFALFLLAIRRQFRR